MDTDISTAPLNWKKGIAGLYRDLTPEDVVPTHGGISANHMVIATLVDQMGGR